MVIININIEGIDPTRTELKKGTYSGGALALRLIDTNDYFPFATLTVNLPDYSHLLEKGEFFIKTWSENEPLIEALRKKDTIFINTGRKIEVGIKATAEIWKFAHPKIVDQINLIRR